MLSRRMVALVATFSLIAASSAILQWIARECIPWPGTTYKVPSIPFTDLGPVEDPNGAPRLGGLSSPDGTEEVMCPLPASEKKKNVGGRDRAGLCVFTSIEYCARYSNERPLFDLQAYMRKHDGGGWPEKVDEVLKSFAPHVQYLQSTTGDLSLLRAALASGRQVAVTYNGHDPHYRGTIYHMVALEHLSERWACISDNNFPSENDRVWMSPAEFSKRHNGSDKGWAVVLLHCGPPPAPTPR